MMFFVISGYCITASAISGIRKGITTRNFIYNRIRRIYPPYLLAVAFFASTRLVRFLITGEAWAPSLTGLLQNLTLTQWLTLVLHPMADAPQNPTLFVAAFWSLNYEIQFYLVMAVGLALTRYRHAPLVQFVGALTLMAMVLNLGWPALAVRGFFIEYWAHFGLGAALYFLLCGGSRQWATGSAALVLLLGFIIWRSLEIQSGQFVESQRVFGEYVVSIGTVLTLLLLRPHDAVVARQWFWRPISAIGAISYSLYLIHQFNLTAVAKVASLMIPSTISVSANLGLQFFLHLLVATVFWSCCERPFQRSSKVAPRPQVPDANSLSAVRRP
jgi:peptidoglycan/LPS O-acetylase OafA/YrhL